MICAVALVIVIFTQYLFVKALDEVTKAVDKPAAVAEKSSSDSKKENKAQSNLIAGKYLIDNIQIKKVGVDHDGKATVLLSYDMTNKSEKESNTYELDIKVFQTKVQLEEAFYIDSPEGYDSQSRLKEVLPDGKKTVTMGFVLLNENDPVTLKISSNFGLSDDSPEIVKEFPLK